jgi:hypothetical protein
MKTLINATKLATSNSPEFIQDLQENIIAPLLKQGATFKGYGALANDYKKEPNPAGIHTLIFDLPNDFHSKGRIPSYEDEGTTSFHYIYYSTLYIIIPMPF